MVLVLVLLLLFTCPRVVAFLPIPGTDITTNIARCNYTSDCYNPPTISDPNTCDDQCETCFGPACEILPGSVIPRCATCPAGTFLSVSGTSSGGGPYSCVSDCEAAGRYEKSSTDCGLCSDFSSSSACDAQSGCTWENNYLDISQVRQKQR